MYRIDEILNLERIKGLMENFYSLTGIPFLLTDPDINRLIDIGGHSLCREFYRKNPAADKLCMQSDRKNVLKLQNTTKKYHIYTCPFGMTEVICPIRIEGQLYALLYMGQFFIEKPNYSDYTKKYGSPDAYGFDEESFSEAYKTVPVRSKEEVEKIVHFMAEQVEILAETGYQKKKLLEQSEKINKQNRELKNFTDLWSSQENLLNTIINSVSAGIFWKDRNAVYKGCNTQFAVDAGVNGHVEEVIGKTDKDLPNVKKDAAFFLRDDRKVLDSGLTLKNREHKIIKEDGKPYWSYTNKVPLRDTENKIIGLVGVYLDITKIKETENRLHEQEEQFRTVVMNSSDPIWIIDLNMSLLFASPSIERVISYSPKELEKIPMEEILTAESLKKVRDMLKEKQKLFTAKVEDPLAQSVRLQLDYISRDKEIVHTEVHISPLLNKNNQLYGMLSIIRDITEQQQMQVKLKQSQKMEALGRLAGGIAHDFNNLLHVVLGYGDMIKMLAEKNQAEETQAEEISLTRNKGNELIELVEPILEAGNKAKHLVEHLLLFNRSEKQQQEVLNIPEIFDEFISMLQRLIGEHIPIHNQIQKNVEGAWINRQQLEQILINIVLNSKEAMSSGGEIDIIVDRIDYDEKMPGEITVIPPGTYVRIMIADTGMGIDEDDLPKIFEPFFSTKENASGSGLGLSAVYAIVNQNGGYIDVHSMIGVGTTFEVLLPHVSLKTAEGSHADQAEISVQEMDSEALRNAHDERVKETKQTSVILLAEDNDMIRRLTKTNLEKRGYTVAAAANGDAAIQLYMQYRERIKFLVLDIVMPGRSGKDVYDYAAAFNPAVKVIFCTGYDNNILSSDFVSRIGGKMIQKPYTIDKLMEKLEGDWSTS